MSPCVVLWFLCSQFAALCRLIFPFGCCFAIIFVQFASVYIWLVPLYGHFCSSVVILWLSVSVLSLLVVTFVVFLHLLWYFRFAFLIVFRLIVVTFHPVATIMHLLLFIFHVLVVLHRFNGILCLFVVTFLHLGGNFSFHSSCQAHVWTNFQYLYGVTGWFLVLFQIVWKLCAVI